MDNSSNDEICAEATSDVAPSRINERIFFITLFSVCFFDISGQHGYFFLTAATNAVGILSTIARKEFRTRKFIAKSLSVICESRSSTS